MAIKKSIFAPSEVAYLQRQLNLEMSACNVSVIIPTLWRSRHIISLVDQLLSWDKLLEIILIDNNPNSRPPDFPINRCTVLNFGENIYVNPAWNEGAKRARGRFLMICNDDISFEPKSLNGLFEKFRLSTVYGLHSRSFDYSGSLITDNDFYVGFGWGCLMILETKNYPFIPNDMKIFRGDDWIAFSHKNRRTFSIPVSGELSASHKGRFDAIKRQDAALFERYRRRSMFRFLFKLVDWIGWNKPIRILTRLKNLLF